MSPKPSKTKTLEKPFQIHYCKYSTTDPKVPRPIDLENLKSTVEVDPKNSYKPSNNQGLNELNGTPPLEASHISNPYRYNSFDISKLQLYNPINKLFFEMKESMADRIGLNHPYHMTDLEHVFDISNQTVLEKPVFIKYSPLLDPVRYMIGKYESNRHLLNELPTIGSTDLTCIPKIASFNNASYIDCFFSYLTSSLLHHHGFLHGLDFYGSYLGIQKQFRFCATDDIDYLRNSDFFNDNVGKHFYIETPDHDGENGLDDEFANIVGSRANRNRLKVASAKNLSAISMTILDAEELTPNSLLEEGLEEVYQNENIDKIDDSDEESNDGTSSDSEENYSSSSENGEQDEEERWETDEDIDNEESISGLSDEDDEIFGYIHNFPIQMICLEKCEGTLDELFVKNQVDLKLGASAFFQVIMSLLAYQKAFKLTHNDLHTNNIMWIKTDLEFLTYRFAGKVYKVPTYGKLFKLIDFGRAIYKFQDKQFCSDSFATGGDAATQYNFEPFFNRNKPRLEPNYSFDLCRLGSSIFDFIMDVDLPISKMNELQKTVNRWCLDDNKKNVLYKKNGEERYPNFKLYKMIARTVHDHTPEAQLEFPFFKQFLVKNNGSEKVLMDLDELLVY